MWGRGLYYVGGGVTKNFNFFFVCLFVADYYCLSLLLGAPWSPEAEVWVPPPLHLGAESGVPPSSPGGCNTLHTQER